MQIHGRGSVEYNKNFTSTHRFGAIPCPILGADECGDTVSIYGEPWGTLETNSATICEVISQSQTVCRHSWVSTVNN